MDRARILRARSVPVARAGARAHPSSEGACAGKPGGRLRLKGTLAAALLFTAMLACGLVPAQQQPAHEPSWRWPDAERIVAVADVHGGYRELVALLEAAGVVDASLEWSGGRTHLVSLGDLLDRGPESRAVMDLLMRLQREAPASGGAVHVVLGNHEVMNLVGDLRYVSDAEYAAFAQEEPSDLRAAAWQRFQREHAEEGSPEENRAVFEERYPPGYFGHRLAFRPEGRYGAWLMSLPALVVVADTVFVHGGLPEMVVEVPADEINRRIRDDLRRYVALRDRLAAAGVLPELDMENDLELALAALDERRGAATAADPAVATALEEFLALSQAPVLGPDGPLWYRGAVYCNPFIERPILEAALSRLGVARAVVGHTVTDDRRVRALYDGQLIMLDTGMLGSYYAGRPAALIIEHDDVSVRYLEPPEQARPEMSHLMDFGATEEELLAALANGRVEARGSTAGATDSGPLLDVHHDGRAVQAIFHPGGRRGSADAELAAHALDRLLGLHLVPPTVVRELDGESGALQLYYADTISETERIEQGLPAGTWCAIEPQFQLMYAFDVLTFNVGRGPDNVLYRRELSSLVLVDHAEAFGTERRPRLADDVFPLSAQLRAALVSLDAAQVEATLSPWLGSRQIRALLARRDALLAQ